MLSGIGTASLGGRAWFIAGSGSAIWRLAWVPLLLRLRPSWLLRHLTPWLPSELPEHGRLYYYGRLLRHMKQSQAPARFRPYFGLNHSRRRSCSTSSARCLASKEDPAVASI